MVAAVTKQLNKNRSMDKKVTLAQLKEVVQEAYDQVKTNTGGKNADYIPYLANVPLLDIASIEYSNAPQSIQRKNNQYIVTISGQPTTASALTAGEEIKQAVAELELPEGVAVTQNQADEQMMEEFGALFGAIATAVFLVFMVMAMQFESCRFSIIVMICSAQRRSDS